MEINKIHEAADLLKAKIAGEVNRSQDQEVHADRYAMAKEGFVQGALWALKMTSNKRTIKPVILAIVGNSGAGKDTFAKMLAKRPCTKRIVSFTTRDIREGEVNGEEHYFVKDFYCGEKFAYTLYGGKHYWTTPHQFDEMLNIYVVDEVGLEQIRDRQLQEPWFNLFSVYITRENIDVSEERTSRDKDRERLDDNLYDAIVANDDTLEALELIADDLFKKVKQKFW